MASQNDRHYTDPVEKNIQISIDVARGILSLGCPSIPPPIVNVISREHFEGIGNESLLIMYY